MAIKKVKYIEPEGYIPKHLRKEFGLGEYAETSKDDSSETTENMVESCGGLKPYDPIKPPKKASTKKKTK